MKWKHRKEIRKKFFEIEPNKIYIPVILREVKKFTAKSYRQRVQKDLEKFYWRLGLTFWHCYHSDYIPKTTIICQSASIWVEMSKLEIFGNVSTNYTMRVRISFANGRRGIYLYYKE